MADVAYETDVAAWATEQARRIRSGQLDRLDLEHIADEIEDVGNSERRELESRLAVLLAHLLKWEFQPSHRCGSWERTIREQRKRVQRKLRQVPSLAPLLQDAEWVEGVWGDAVVLAIKETGVDGLPEACPWSMDAVMTEAG